MRTYATASKRSLWTWVNFGSSNTWDQVIAPFFDSREENVNFFFRVVRRIETLHPEFLDSKLNEFQVESADKATHLVEQVVYGAGFICSMQNILKKNDPADAKRRIYITADEYFNQNYCLTIRELRWPSPTIDLIYQIENLWRGGRVVKATDC